MQPYRGYLLVQVIKEDEVIVTNQDAEKTKQRGKVVSVGAPRITDYGVEIPSKLKPGDSVAWEPFAETAYTFSDDGNDYALIKDSWVMGVSR